MSRTPSPLAAVFDAYGDDAEAGLAALANTDPAFWHAYVDEAAERRYRNDYSSHRRTLKVSMQKDATRSAAGQARLFEPGPGAMVELREVLVYDGTEYHLADLEGEEGAAILRKVAERDLAPALTTVERSRSYLRLAEHLTTETHRLDRSVKVAEVIVMAVAS
jgi:hypothetical protein